MKFRTAVLVLYCMSSILYLIACSAKETKEDSPVAREAMEDSPAKQVVDLLYAGNYSALYAKFDDQMKAALTQEQLTQNMDTVKRQFGKLESIKEVTSTPLPGKEGYTVYQVTTANENGDLIYTITLGPDSRIAGLYVKPNLK